jgi:glycosyltransferase involved in cell wall biosynthesis
VASLVSTVIPTFDRRRDVVVAVRSALAQTYTPQEVLVVDDGSRDGTAAHLRELHGDRVTIVQTNRLGVSGARNRGMAAARGEYIALLDSDDEWEPQKLEKQVAYLEARPDYGMVLTDVAQMDKDRRTFALFERRKHIPEDGMVLRHVLRQPALAPSSALLRKRVIDEVGGFDGSLPTAEDIDLHLRVALRFPIGIISEPLTRCMRDNGGLSALPRTYEDYMFVMERFLLDHRHEIPAEERAAALREASLRNMRGLLGQGHVREALALGARVASHARGRKDVAVLARFAPAVLRQTARKLAR